jgi:hypothetical protein
MSRNNNLKQLAIREQTVNLTASNNLFGSIAGRQIGIGGGYDFVPADGIGNVIDLTGDSVNVNATWLGLSSKAMQFWAYNYCSPLAAVVDRLAEADANGIIEFVKEDGTTNTKWRKNQKLVRIMRRMKNPNPWQTWEEFDSEQVVMCKIFGYCPVWAIGPSGMDKSWTKALINLNPFVWQPVRNTEFNYFSSKGSQITEWTASIGGESYRVPSSDILLIKDGFIDSRIGEFGLPISKVAGLDYFVSNICAAMEADNVLLKKKGPLGVFSHDPKPDIAGWTPLDPTEKDELQDDLKRYGLTFGQLQYVISKTPLKWNAMSFNLRDLMTKETVRQGIDGICDRFGYPAELMSGKNATYENRNSAEKFLYQNNVIPFSLRRMARYNEFFELEEDLLSLDYDHLPVLQEDVLNAGQAAEALSKSLDLDFKGGYITWNEWRRAKNMDAVAGMDIYYPEWAKKNGISLNPQDKKTTDKTEKTENDEPTPKDTATEE